jgi:hypothetical protein
MTTARRVLFVSLILAALAALAADWPPVGPCGSDADCARRFPDRVRFDDTGRPLPY